MSKNYFFSFYATVVLKAEIMFINPILATNINTPQTKITFRGSWAGKLARGISKDVFQRSSNSVIPPAPIISTTKDVQKLLKQPYYKITKKFLDSLSDESYNMCIGYCADDVDLYATSEAIAVYSEVIFRGAQKMMGDKPFKVIGIGQSPDSIVEYLKFKDIDTAIMPISYLLFATKSALINISKSKKIKKYLDYVKVFGFDINKMNPDTT